MKRIIAAFLASILPLVIHAQVNGMLAAAQIALDDYSKRLDQEQAVKWEYSDYVSNIANYSIGLAESKDLYVVVVSLKKTDVKINGGGGIYYIDKKKLTIARFVGNE